MDLCLGQSAYKLYDHNTAAVRRLRVIVAMKAAGKTFGRSHAMFLTISRPKRRSFLGMNP